MISLHGQFKVREQAILDGKKRNQKTIYIPNYYVGKLYNPSDSIDLYQGNLNDYYEVETGTRIVSFDKDFSFDYSNEKLINAKQIVLNRSFGKNIYLKALNVFSDDRNVNNYSVNLTFNENLLQNYSSDEAMLFIHVYWRRDSNSAITRFDVNTSLNNQLLVEDKYIFSSPIGDIRPQDIEHIDVGIHNLKTNKTDEQTTVDMKKK